MCRLDCRDDSLRARQELKSVHCLGVGDRLVVRASNLGEPGVLGSYAGIVQSSGDGMGRLGLAVLVLENEGAHAMQHADLSCRDSRGMPLRLNALSASLESVERDVGVGNEIGEDAERIRTTTNTCRHCIGQSAVAIKKLSARLGTDHPLELSDHHREGMWTRHRADYIVGVVDRGDPVTHGVVHGVLQRLGARLNSDHLSPK